MHTEDEMVVDGVQFTNRHDLSSPELDGQEAWHAKSKGVTKS